MICKFCGNVIEDNSDFCFICGQKVVANTPSYSAQVYSQKPEGAPAEIAPEAAAAPVAPVEPVEPVYAPPVVPEEDVCKKCKKAKKAKKEKKEKAPVSAADLSVKAKVIIGLLAAIFPAVAGVMCSNIIVVAVCVVLTAVVGVLLYKKYKEVLDAGYEAKAADMFNTAMIGLCSGMVVVVLFLIKTYMLG